MPLPALNIPIRANLDDLKKDMSNASALSGIVARQIAKQFIDMNASMLKETAFKGAVTGFRTLLGVMGPLSLGITAVVGAFKLMDTATELAKEKIEEFYQTSDKAAKANVTTDFFQRMTKSGEALKLTVDDVNGALDTFAQKSANRLGGSDLDKKIEELRAGNLTGLANANAVSSATTTEEKMRGAVALITELLEKGKQAAALDIASTAFGPKLANNLRSNNTYLQEMLANADKIAASKIVSEQEIANAVDLKNRLEDAQKVLADRFKPIQDDLAKLGMNYQESWVGIYQNIASAVKVADDLYGALKDIPDIFARAGNASFWAKLTELSGKLGLNSDPASLGITLKSEANFGLDAAREKLNAMLGDPNAIKRSMREVIDTQTKVLGDSSKAPVKKPTESETRDPFESALDQGDRRIAIVKAETASIGQNSEARERAKIVANLEEAAKRANAAAGKDLYGITEATNPKIAEQADKMLAAAKAAREQQTAFQGLQNALSFAGDQIIDVLDRASQKGANFGDIMRDVLRNVQKQMLTAAITGEGAFGKLFGLSGVGGGVGGILGSLGSLFGTGVAKAEGGIISGPGTGTSDSIHARVSNGEFIVNAKATGENRALLEAINDNRIPAFADGGMVSASTIPSPPMMIGGGSVTTIAPQIAVTVQGSPGASSADHTAMGERIAQAAGPAIQSLVAKELRTQMRPGGILKR